MALPTFLLIHGFAHSAASWTLLVEALARRGAPAIAVDLPSDDPLAGTRAYADTVLSRTALVEDAVIVAHSMGGLTGPIVAGERPCRELIFLCAALPKIGMSIAAQMEAEPEMLAQWYVEHPIDLVAGPEGTWDVLDAGYAKEVYYHDCDPRLQDWAVTQLRRQGELPIIEDSPLEQWPDVPTRAFYAVDDHAVSLEWSRHALRDRYGVTLEEIPGGHSPFLSRPDELAELFLGPYTS